MLKRCMGCMQELKAGHICSKCAYDNQNWTNPARALPLRTILNGKYLIGAVIGEGGFGITYVAWDMLINSKVAIKEYFPSELATRDATFTGANVSRKSLTLLNGANERLLYKKGLDRFVQEAEKLAKFRQLTGIVSVQDFFYENNTAYMVMEYIEGTTLRTYLQDHGEKLSAEETFQMMKPVMETLSEVHKEGIIHRDISPDNIMITHEGQLKLIDFGAARYVGGNDEKSLTVILKHGYAPEEQYRSDGKQGPWTDVYALCAVIYRMITGKVPAEPIQRMSEKLDSAEMELASCKALDAQKQKALIKGLAIKRERRYQSVQELYKVLYQKGKEFPGKWLAGVGIIAGVICAAVIAIVCGIVFKRNDNHESIDGMSMQEEAEPEYSGTMGRETETEVIVENKEPEYLKALRIYYNENFGEEGGTPVFLDLTGDGQEELLVTRHSEEETEDRAYVRGGLKGKNEIWVMEYCETGVEQIYYKWGMESERNEGTVEFFVAQDGDKISLLSTLEENGEMLNIRFMRREDGKRYCQEMILSSESSEIFQAKAVRISGKHHWMSGQMLDDYESVLNLQECFNRTKKIAETATGIVSSSALIHNGKEACMVAVVMPERKENEKETQLFSVWYTNGSKTAEAESIRMYEDTSGLGRKAYYDGEVYQFGKDEHFFVDLDVDQLKYCYEDGEICRRSPDFSFLKGEDGRVTAEFWTEDGFINYAPLYYFDLQYVEYGCKEADFEILKDFENYPEIMQEIKNAFLKADSIALGTAGGDRNITINESDVKIINLMENAEGYFYVNCQVKAEEFRWLYESDDEGWGNAELRTEGNQLVVQNIYWGKREEHSDLGLPVYYKDGSIEFPEYEKNVEESRKITLDSPYRDSGIPDENLWKELYIDYITKDIQGQLEFTGGAGTYVLAYVNDDLIPELFRSGTFNAEGGRLFTVANGQMNGICTATLGVSYMERENLILESGGSMDVYYDNVYALEDGAFMKLHEGDYEVKYYSDKDLCLYRWDGRKVGEIEYQRILEEEVGESKMIMSYDVECSAEEMLQRLMNMP